MNLPELKRLLVEATPGQWELSPSGVVVDDKGAVLLDRRTKELIVALRNAAPELIAACEERDRYKADSKALDEVLSHLQKKYIIGQLALCVETKNIAGIVIADISEHLRKHLEGKT